MSDTNKLDNLALAIGFGIISSVIINVGAYFAVNATQDKLEEEKGTILSKSNGELVIDLDGDKKVDRVLKVRHWDDNVAPYEYAQPGDQISYNNSLKRDTVYENIFGKGKIKKVNGKSAKKIQEWYAMTQHTNSR